MALSHTTLYEFLAPCQISEKTNDTIPRKHLDRRTDGRTEGQKDGRTDRPYFIGCFWLPPGVQQKRNFHKDLHHLERDNSNPYHTFLAFGKGTSNYQLNILRCWLCFKDHKIAECNQFVTLSVDECLRLMKVCFKLCFNCLSNSHRINNCNSKVFCRVDNCQRRHHMLLHPVNKGNNSNSSSND